MGQKWKELEFPPVSWEWNATEVRSYALAMGAPADVLDPKDVGLLLGEQPVVLPTFAVLLADAHSLRYFPLPGVEYDALDVIYAGHELEVFAPLPAVARGTTSTRLVNVGDVSAGILAVREATSVDDRGRVLARNTVTSIIRGASIGVPAQRPARASTQERELDQEVVVPTLPQQAFLYAQSGDDNPLHLNPDAARTAGFDRPILHGLCTYGIVAHALLRECTDRDWTSLRRISARFTSPVVPGDTLVVRAAAAGNGFDFAAWVRDTAGAERQVLAQGSLTLDADARA